MVKYQLKTFSLKEQEIHEGVRQSLTEQYIKIRRKWQILPESQNEITNENTSRGFEKNTLKNNKGPCVTHPRLIDNTLHFLVNMLHLPVNIIPLMFARSGYRFKASDKCNSLM